MKISLMSFHFNDVHQLRIRRNSSDGVELSAGVIRSNRRHLCRLTLLTCTRPSEVLQPLPRAFECDAERSRR